MRKALIFCILIPLVITTCNPRKPSASTATTTSPASTITSHPPANTPLPITDTPLPDPTITATIQPTEMPLPTKTPTPQSIPLITIQGEILFSVYPDGDITIMNADGSDRRTLLDRPTDFEINLDRHANWLPDGTGISYTVDDFGQAEIWLMNSDGSNQRFLIGDVATNSSHAWSPDGRLLIYVSTQNKIMLYNLANQSITPLTDGHFRSESDPDCSPDGSRITFSATEAGNQDIYFANLDGSDLTRITNHPETDQNPDWSPDGSKIVFSATRDGDHVNDIYIIDLGQGTEAEGNVPVQLTFGDTLDVDPDWSPDGLMVVFAAHTFGASHATLFIVTAHGDQYSQLTEENTYFSPQWHP
jgi:Tol biopolymer transport system component